MPTQLQLYRLGFEEPVSKETYENVKQKYQGALIFAKVQEYKDAEHKFNKNETGVQKGERNGQFFETTKTTIIGEGEEVIETEYNLGMPSYYIYANGIEYKVANADALEVVFNQVKILNGGEETEGSVRYIVEKAIQNLKFDANKFYEIVDHTKSNVDVSVVEGTDTSLLVLTAPGTDLVVKTGTDTPENEWPKHLKKPEVEGEVVEQPSDIWPAPQKGYYYIQTTPVIGTNDEYLSSSDAITKNRANAEKGTVDYEDYKVDSHKTAFIYDGEKWMALDGNVSADNVYFQDGIQRSVACGAFKTTDGEIVREGINYNLKEYLELMLLEEVWPETGSSTGKVIVPPFSLSIATIPNLTNVLYEASKNEANEIVFTEDKAQNNSLVEVGTTYGFKMDPLSQAITKNAETSYTGTASKMFGMKYGSANSADGPVEDISSIQTEVPVFHCTYDDTFNIGDAGIATSTITFDVSVGFDGMNDKSATAEHLDTNSTIQLTSAEIDLGTIVEGTNVATLSWSGSNIMSTRNRVDETTKDLDELPARYYASNKGALSPDKCLKKINSAKWSDTNNKASLASQSNTITITGVYPFYTNCGKIAKDEDACKTDAGKLSGATIGLNEDNLTKLSLFNYTSKGGVTKTYYLNWSAITEKQSSEEPNMHWYFYVPQTKKCTLSLDSICVNTNNGKWENEARLSKQQGSRNINGIEYDIYSYSAVAGALGMRVVITSK